MKKIIVLFIFLVDFTVNAQTSKKTTGPKAKNNKVWENKKTTTLVLVNNYKKTSLFGGRFKNQKQWNKKSSENSVVVKTRTQKENITGPKAKNTKPWKKD